MAVKTEWRRCMVRLTPNGYEATEQAAKDNGLSVSEFIRNCMEGDIADYYGKVKYTNGVQGREVQNLLKTIFDEQTKLQHELNSIGVNFNQEVKLRNAINKRMDSQENVSGAEAEKVFSDSTSLDLERLEGIMNTFYDALKKVGDELCRLRESR